MPVRAFVLECSCVFFDSCRNTNLSDEMENDADRLRKLKFHMVSEFEVLRSIHTITTR